MGNQEVRTILIDVDGVLTDNKVWFNHSGERTKAFNSSDIWAIRELISNGFRVIIITASNWPGINHFVKRTGAELMQTRDKAQHITDPYYCVVNDVWDMELAKGAVKSFCPSDAFVEIKAISKILNAKGGEGVISELVLELKDKLLIS